MEFFDTCIPKKKTFGNPLLVRRTCKDKKPTSKRLAKPKALMTSLNYFSKKFANVQNSTFQKNKSSYGLLSNDSLRNSLAPNRTFDSHNDKPKPNGANNKSVLMAAGNGQTQSKVNESVIQLDTANGDPQPEDCKSIVNNLAKNTKVLKFNLLKNGETYNPIKNRRKILGLANGKGIFNTLQPKPPKGDKLTYGFNEKTCSSYNMLSVRTSDGPIRGANPGQGQGILSRRNTGQVSTNRNSSIDGFANASLAGDRDRLYSETEYNLGYIGNGGTNRETYCEQKSGKYPGEWSLKTKIMQSLIVKQAPAADS